MMLKSCDHGVICLLTSAFYFWRLYLGFKIHKLCGQKIILMNKLSKNLKPLLVTDLIFCSNPKAKIKIQLFKGTRVLQPLGWPSEIRHCCRTL